MFSGSKYILFLFLLFACGISRNKLAPDQNAWPTVLKIAMKDFVRVPGGTSFPNFQEEISDQDPILVKARITIPSFLLQRYEVSISEYMAFCQWKADSLNRPDTLCFIRNGNHLLNDPSSMLYFWHPKYLNYPIVGISYEQ